MPDPLRIDPIAEARRQWVERGWGASAPGMAAVTSIVRSNQLLVGRVEDALRPFRLTFARYEVLMLLVFSRHGALPMGKMGERLQVHPASVTNAVVRLEADGLVRRDRHPDDGRSVLSRITARGQRVALAATRTLNEDVFSPLELSDRDLDSLTRVLTRLRRHAGDFS